MQADPDGPGFASVVAAATPAAFLVVDIVCLTELLVAILVNIMQR